MPESRVKTAPHQVLGLSRNASAEEIRVRYLELVREFPPDREPDRFREIRAAYEAASDPLVLAQALLQPPDDVPPEWSTVIQEQRQRPPALGVDFLLSLGNKDSASQSAEPGKPR